MRGMQTSLRVRLCLTWVTEKLQACLHGAVSESHTTQTHSIPPCAGIILILMPYRVHSTYYDVVIAILIPGGALLVDAE